MSTEQQVINIERAAKIAGFMSNAELAWLASQALTHNRIVEIGSLVGRSTRALADHTEGFVLAVDDFKGPRDCTMSWKERQSIPERFRANLEDHLASGKVIQWTVDHGKLDMAECPAPEPEKPYDMVFVDGDHRYERVLLDLRFWKDKIAPAGMLCGHDYDLAYPGILQACSEILGDTVVLVPGTSLWTYIIPVLTENVCAERCEEQVVA